MFMAIIVECGYGITISEVRSETRIKHGVGFLFGIMVVSVLVMLAELMEYGSCLFAMLRSKWKRRVRLTPSGTRDLTPRAK